MSNILYGTSEDKIYRTELIASILEAADPITGLSEGRIMFEVLESKTIFEGYVYEIRPLLKEMVRLGLLEYDSDTELYHCNGNGLRFLELYDNLKEHLDSIE